MQVYLDLLKDVLYNGIKKSDRTGVGTYSVFGRQVRFNLSKGFPILTTKRLHFRSIAHELFWMLNGSTNNNDLEKYGITIWREWADKDGELGPVYGKQWREWKNYSKDINTSYQDLPDEIESWLYKTPNHTKAWFKPIDQIVNAIKTIKENPDSRRNVISAWNTAEIANMKLPPCHYSFQFYVADEKLSCHMTQRSADIFLGVPYNIASYALLTNLMAYITNLQIGDLIISFGDLHLYQNHVDQANLQLIRRPKLLPTLQLDFDKEKYGNLKNLDKAFEAKEIYLEDYEAYPSIPAPVAV
jgi:thymidylate synthase